MLGIEDKTREWLAGSTEWQTLLNHFDLGSGFSFVVLLVPSEPFARSCREALEEHLRLGGKSLHEVELLTPKDLANLPGTLLNDLAVSKETGAIWVELVVSRDLEAYRSWRDAWQEAVAKLNQFRNLLGRRFEVPLLFVGAPWLKEVIREQAPDLWSIRSVVTVLEPVFEPLMPLEFPHLPEQHVSASSPDPELALEKAAELLGTAESESERARLLLRAAAGFLDRREWARGNAALDEVHRINETHFLDSEALASLYVFLSQSRMHEGRLEQAKQYLTAALGLEAAKEAVPFILNGLGDVAYLENDFDAAKALYLESADAFEDNGFPGYAAKTYRSLGNTSQVQGDLEDARRYYLKALAASDNGQDTAGSYHDLGDLAMFQRDFSTAREWYLKSLAIDEQEGNSYDAAKTYASLGAIAGAQGYFKEFARLLALSIEFYRKHEPELAADIEALYFKFFDEAPPEDKDLMNAAWREAGLEELPRQLVESI